MWKQESDSKWMLTWQGIATMSTAKLHWHDYMNTPLDVESCPNQNPTILNLSLGLTYQPLPPPSSRFSPWISGTQCVCSIHNWLALSSSRATWQVPIGTSGSTRVSYWCLVMWTSPTEISRGPLQKSRGHCLFLWPLKGCPTCGRFPLFLFALSGEQQKHAMLK